MHPTQLNFKPSRQQLFGRKLLICSLALALIVACLSPIVAAEFSDFHKEEVVYAVLEPDSSFERLIVINQFTLATAGEVKDYGEYSDVQALDDQLDLNYDRNGSEISFMAHAGYNYYRGELEGRELPWLVHFSYQLDGQEVKPEDLVGASGEFKFHIAIKNNPQVDQALREGFILQLSIQLDKSKYSDLKSDASMQAEAGSKSVLNWIMIPRENKAAEAEFSCQVEDFSLEAPRLAAVPLQLEGDKIPDDLIKTDDIFTAAKHENPLGKLNDGVTSLQSGATDLRQGSSQIDEALAKLQQGSADLSSEENLGKLKSGLTKLRTGTEGLSEGLQQYSAGVDKLAENYPQLSDGLSTLAEGIKTLGDQAPQLETGLTDWAAGLDQIVSGLAQYVPDAEESSPGESLDLNQALETIDGMASGLENLSPLLTLDLTPFQTSLAALSNLELPSQEELQALESIAQDQAAGSSQDDPAVQLQQALTDLTTYLPYLPDSTVRTNYQLTLQELQAAASGMAQKGQALQSSLGKLQNILLSLQQLKDIDFTSLNQSLGQLTSLQTNYGPKLANMAEQLATQRQALVDLAQTLSQGAVADFSTLYQGLKGLQDGFTELQTGLNAYLEGIKTMSKQMPDLQNGTKDFGAGLQQLAESSEDLRQGNAEFTQGFAEYAAGLDQYYAGVNSLSEGINQLTDKYKDFDKGIGQLADGLDEFKSGLDDFKQEIDPQLKELIQDILPQYQPRSFVSSRNQVDSVQFVIVLPAVAQAETETQVIEEEHDNRNFLEKLGDLFS